MADDSDDAVDLDLEIVRMARDASSTKWTWALVNKDHAGFETFLVVLHMNPGVYLSAFLLLVTWSESLTTMRP